MSVEKPTDARPGTDMGPVAGAAAEPATGLATEIRTIREGVGLAETTEPEPGWLDNDAAPARGPLARPARSA